MRRGIAATLAASAALALIPASAGATFHLMKITEVAPNPGAPGTAFIELQMYAPGQNFVSGHPIRLYDADGGTPVTTFSFPAGGRLKASWSCELRRSGGAAVESSPIRIVRWLSPFGTPAGKLKVVTGVPPSAS